MPTQLRDLTPEGERPRPAARRGAPALLHALAALETIEAAIQDPRRLASSAHTVRSAVAVLRTTLRQEDLGDAPAAGKARDRRGPSGRPATSDPLADLSALEDVLGKSPAWEHVLEIVARVADTPVTALLEGESGTGKELLARVIHRTSHLSREPFVAVNCGALPGPLLEAELFGHTKGAFTGAVADRKGRFREADGGTLFLDEIGELPFDLQAKLLRALQSGEIQRLGQDKVERVSVRILAATNRDLVRMSQEGRFREDLFYRLSAIRILLPPLRERPEEIIPLLEFFLDRYGKAFGRPLPRLSSGARAALLRYRFPGNLRELENVAKHLVLLARAEEARVEDLPLAVQRADVPATRDARRAPRSRDELVQAKKEVLEELEAEFVRDALVRAQGNVSRAARETGMNRAYLQRLVQARRDRDGD